MGQYISYHLFFFTADGHMIVHVIGMLTIYFIQKFHIINNSSITKIYFMHLWVTCVPERTAKKQVKFVLLLWQA